MGCDYYIQTELVIEYEDKDGKINTIFTDRTIKSGYIFIQDEDSDDNQTLYKKFNTELEKTIKANKYNKMLFKNGEWVKESYKTKYEYYLMNTYKDIIKIKKVYKKNLAWERM